MYIYTYSYELAHGIVQVLDIRLLLVQTDLEADKIIFHFSLRHFQLFRLRKSLEKLDIIYLGWQIKY